LFLAPVLGHAAEPSSGGDVRGTAKHVHPTRHRLAARTGNGHRWSAPEAAEISTDIDGAAWREVGMASYYGPRHNGHRAADGSTFHQEDLTAAHRSLPFGTHVLVTVPATGRQVVVTITDRLGTRRRVIDLSIGAARELGIIQQGVAEVTIAKT